MSHPKPTPPDAECIASGAKYACLIDYGDRNRTGKIYDESGLRWRYGVRENPSCRRRENPFNKPDFVVEGADGQQGPTIRRTAFIPSRFHIIENESVVGRIGMLSIFRNRYSIEIDGVGAWIFQMPMFTVNFRGDSAIDTEIWVIMGPGKMQWNLLLKPGLDDLRLVAAVAFIHNESWNCS
jgi:hypothetical protein